MKFYRLLTMLLSATVLFSCSEQDVVSHVEPATVVSPEAEIEAILHEHIAILASDQFEGRAPATPGEEKTITYLRQQFEALGIAPGNGDSYFQAVAVTELTTVSDAILQIQGSDYNASFSYGDQMMVGTQQ
ncbi:MAG: peptidase M28, partial [Proteobacteria bacterium]|nr:peptidase M28 [Pseudomonadota bacterium]